MRLILNLLQSVVDFIFYLIPYPNLSKEQLENLKIVAHRGWHDNEDIKENTMAGFKKAYKNGIWGIEFDIRWTNDGVPMVCHDADTSRVWDKDIEIDGISFKNLREELPEIPTLKEVVDEFIGKMHFFIELKNCDFKKIDEYKKTLKEILSPLKEIDDFHIFAQSMDLILKFDCFNKKTYILVSEVNAAGFSEQVISHDIGGLAGHYLLLTDSIIQKHKEKGQLVGTGYCRTMNCLSREVNREVDFVFTNHPWYLAKSIESLSSKN
jgi:glycerophosphoryl diester phosphodiesterase